MLNKVGDRAIGQLMDSTSVVDQQPTVIQGTKLFDSAGVVVYVVQMNQIMVPLCTPGKRNNRRDYANT